MEHPPLYVTFSVCQSVCLSVHPYICQSIVHHVIIIFGTMCKMMISPILFFLHFFRHCFNFFKSLIFLVVKDVKGKKLVQNDKKLCVLCSIYQELHIISSFVVHKCKMMISSGVFFNLQNFSFLCS